MVLPVERGLVTLSFSLYIDELTVPVTCDFIGLSWILPIENFLGLLVFY